MSPSTHPRPTVDALAESLVVQASELREEHDHLSRIIEHLDLPVSDLDDQYQSVPSHGFDFEAMIRVFLYKHATEYSDRELAHRLKHWPYLQFRFSLDRAPRQQTLSYTWRHRLTLRTRQFVKTAAVGIRDELYEHGIVSRDLAPPEPDETDIDDEGNPTEAFTSEQIMRTTRLARQHAYPAFKTGRASNAKYDDRLIHDFHTKMSMETGWGTPQTARSFRHNPNRGPDEEIHHDTHLRAIKKLATPSDYQYTLDEFTSPGARSSLDWERVRDTLDGPFELATERMLSTIKGTEMFHQPVVAGIDITPFPLHSSPWKIEEDVGPEDEPVLVHGRKKYPREDYPEMVSGLKGDHSYGYKFATLTIVGNNVPLVLAIEPVKDISQWESEDAVRTSRAEVVERLLEKASKHVDIHLVMADREFATHRVQDVLDKHGVTYLIPKPKYVKDWEGIEKVKEHEVADVAVEPDVPLYLDGEKSHDVQFMYVPSRSRNGKYAVFLTNRSDVSPDEAMGLCSRYSRRWDIENEYKTIKRFLPTMASTDYRVRLFNFIFACVLYNIWRLTDYLLKLAVGIDVRAKPVVRAGEVAEIVADFLRVPH